jgi:predicted nucleic acid-binding protein
MQYFFDASSIYNLSKEGKTISLVRHCTSSLARYELGNILLKERKIRKIINEAEQRYLLITITKALNFMSIIDVKNNEQEIIDLAISNDLSFYDSSYFYLAKKSNMTLVTEDGPLAKKAKEQIEVKKAQELI